MQNLYFRFHVIPKKTLGCRFKGRIDTEMQRKERKEQKERERQKGKKYKRERSTEKNEGKIEEMRERLEREKEKWSIVNIMFT